MIIIIIILHYFDKTSEKDAMLLTNSTSLRLISSLDKRDYIQLYFTNSY